MAACYKNRATELPKINFRKLLPLTLAGLASAFIEGVECSLAPFVAAMDGDLQHDPADIPTLLETMNSTGCDIVSG